MKVDAGIDPLPTNRHGNDHRVLRMRGRQHCQSQPRDEMNHRKTPAAKP